MFVINKVTLKCLIYGKANPRGRIFWNNLSKTNKKKINFQWKRSRKIGKNEEILITFLKDPSKKKNLTITCLGMEENLFSMKTIII